VRAKIAALSGGQRQSVDVFKVYDRIVVLRPRRNAGAFDAQAASREQILAAIMGAEFVCEAEVRQNGQAA
jgi:ABC-type sugar transport system ATPase subunit